MKDMQRVPLLVSSFHSTPTISLGMKTRFTTTCRTPYLLSFPFILSSQLHYSFFFVGFLLLLFSTLRIVTLSC